MHNNKVHNNNKRDFEEGITNDIKKAKKFNNGINSSDSNNHNFSMTQEELAEQVSWLESPVLFDSQSSDHFKDLDDMPSKSLFSSFSMTTYSSTPNIGSENDSMSKSALSFVASLIDSSAMTQSPDVSFRSKANETIIRNYSDGIASNSKSIIKFDSNINNINNPLPLQDRSNSIYSNNVSPMNISSSNSLKYNGNNFDSKLTMSKPPLMSQKVNSSTNINNMKSSANLLENKFNHNVGNQSLTTVSNVQSKNIDIDTVKSYPANYYNQNLPPKLVDKTKALSSKPPLGAHSTVNNIDRRHSISSSNNVIHQTKIINSAPSNYSSIAYHSSTAQNNITTKRQSYPINNYNTLVPLESTIELVSDDVMLVLEEMERKALENYQSTQSDNSFKSSKSNQASVDSDIFISQAEMDMWDELERQALSKHSESLKSDKISNINSNINLIIDNNSRSLGHDRVELNMNDLKFLRLKAISISINRKSRLKSISSRRISSTGSCALNDVKYTLILKDQWYDTELSVDDTFHILLISKHHLYPDESSNDSNIEMVTIEQSQVFITLSDDNGILILHPDILVSPTRIAESCNCVRRSVLSERVKSSGGLSGPAVLGNLKHSFIEVLMTECLENISNNPYLSINNIISSDRVNDIMKEAIVIHKESLFAIQQSEMDAMKTLLYIVEPTKEWIFNMFNKGYNINNNTKSIAQFNNKLSSIKSSEESIWCPLLGIKGQLDLIISSKSSLFTNNDSVIPLELKSGNWKSSTASGHRAQVILYILILIIRNIIETKLIADNNVNLNPVSLHGLLLYLNEEIQGHIKLDIIRPKWIEIQSLIINRNNLSIYLQKSLDNNSDTDVAFLPNLIQKTFECETCYQSAECMIYHSIETNKKFKSNESLSINDAMLSSGVSELFLYHMKDIQLSHISYYQLWDRLIDLESKSLRKNQNIFWSTTSSIAQSISDSCISGFFLSENDDNQCLLTFLNYYNNCDFKVNFNNNDRVIVSLERLSPLASNDIDDTKDVKNNNLDDLTNVGYIEPHVAVGYLVSFAFDKIQLQFSSIPKRLIRLCTRINTIYKDTDRINTYVRFDRDDISIGINTMRSNMMSLLIDNYEPRTFKLLKPNITDFMKRKENSDNISKLLANNINIRKQRLRHLIIDLHPPQLNSQDNFSSHLIEVFSLFNPKSISIEKYVKLLETLNQFVGNKYDSVMDQIKNLTRHSYFNEDCNIENVYIDNCNNIHLSEDLIIYQGCSPFELYPNFLKCNSEQKLVIKNVLNSKDYSLILGLPGTGKSSTLSLLTRIIIARQEKVLISSYTHSAIDNLLINLIESNVSKYIIARLGSIKSIHSYVSNYLSDNTIGNYFDHISNYCRILACTVLQAAKDPFIQKFDSSFCIIDEAGQITQPTILGPLLYSKIFILVGDDRQLRPLVSSDDAISLGMDISLFQRLAEAHPINVTTLVTQYRMNEDIMYLCNNLIYSQKMICGNESIAKARFIVPNYEISNIYWLDKCISMDQSVVFLNTDELSNISVENDDTLDSNSKSNFAVSHIEVNIIKQLTHLLRKSNYNMRQLGIISPYRIQVHHIKKMLKSYHMYAYDNDVSLNNNQCEVSTIDRYQGRDMEAVIFSTVRSKDEINSSELLQDWRRINVAITRAKKKLIIIGSIFSMSKITILKQLIDLLIEKHWIINLCDDDINELELEDVYGHDIS